MSGDALGIDVAHTGNGFWVDTDLSGSNVITAGSPTLQYLNGCSLNSYNGFSRDQIGKLESKLKGS